MTALRLYAEIDGIWHLIADGQTLCGKPFVDTSELDFEPRPMCWRCHEAEVSH